MTTLRSTISLAVAATLLGGCAADSPLAPPDPLATDAAFSSDQHDRDTPPPRPLPPIDDPGDPPRPLPPIEDPVQPEPPVLADPPDDDGSVH